MLESEGESVFEVWKDGLCEVGRGDWKVIEEEGLSWGEEKPRYVEKGERERRQRRGSRRRRDGATFHHCDLGGRSHFDGGGIYLLMMQWHPLVFKQ